MESKSERKVKFDHWLGAACPAGVTHCSVMPGDASFRQYYRVQSAGTSYVAMDAPPPENCQSFTIIAAALSDMGLNAPRVESADLENGFLLLTDLGETTFLQAFCARPHVDYAAEWYARALQALAVMQGCRSVSLPPFGREWMEREWAWHREWFLEKWLGLSTAAYPALDTDYEKLIQSALHQPQVFMHRDYHSANLMLLPGNGVGILDFQDAFIGPLTYDLASLLRDCYVDWPPAKVQEWALYYANLLRAQGQLTDVSDEAFIQWFDWMGLQRHIKALLTFARKYVRDQQPRYLQYVPRTLNYIITISQRYSELAALTDFYATTVLPAVRNAKPLCVP